MKKHTSQARPDGEDADDSDGRISAWNARLIDVITDCEDDVRRYRDTIERINGVRACNMSVLDRCMKNADAHRHLALFTALRIIEMRFRQACSSAAAEEDGPASAATQLMQHIELIGLMMRAMLSQMEQAMVQGSEPWDYGNSLLSHLVERRLRIAIDDAVTSLHKQFSCTLITVLMTAIEPAMKSVQDRLSLRPELPLDVKAFAGAMLGLKCNCRYGAPFNLTDLASDVSQIFKIPRTICLSA
jgi:hypothetical protein